MTAYVEKLGDRLIVWNGNADKRGAITPLFYTSIAAATKAAQDPKIRSVIISSQGDFFCAGGDLNALRERRNLSEIERQGKIEILHDVIRAAHFARYGTIACRPDQIRHTIRDRSAVFG